MEMGRGMAWGTRAWFNLCGDGGVAPRHHQTCTSLPPTSVIDKALLTPVWRQPRLARFAIFIVRSIARTVVARAAPWQNSSTQRTRAALMCAACYLAHSLTAHAE